MSNTDSNGDRTQFVQSHDGTRIAYNKLGSGPTLLVVNGALGYRDMSFAKQLTTELAKHFTVIDYDRRGRGQSGDQRIYSVDREIDDILALIQQAAGGPCYVFAQSSGAALALRAAANGVPMKALVAYEPPYMIVTEGGRFGGYGLFLSKGVADIRRGKVVFLYNLLDLKRTLWEGPELKAGKHTIVFDFKSDGSGLGKGGTGVLSVDGKEVARNSMEHTIPVTFPEDETFDVGQDTRTGVALVKYRYDPPFKFTGKINKLTFKLEPEGQAKR